MDYVDALLYKKGYIKIFGEITDRTARVVIPKLINKGLSKKPKPINVLINTPGGCINSSLAIADAIKFAESAGCAVNTIGIGECISCGAFLLVHGTKRYAAENCTIMMHEASYAVGMDYDSNNKKYQRYLAEHNQNFYERMAIKSNRKKDIPDDVKVRDFKKLIKNSVWLTASDALRLGWIDGLWKPNAPELSEQIMQ